MQPLQPIVFDWRQNRTSRAFASRDKIDNTYHFDVWVNSSALQKYSWIAHGFVREYLCSCTGYGLGQSIKRCGKSCSLHSKKFFGWGMRVFCEWRHKWRTFWPPWPTSPGSGPKPLDGSISLKFSLETRLQSESFDTLDDLLGFRVQ